MPILTCEPIEFLPHPIKISDAPVGMKTQIEITGKLPSLTVCIWGIHNNKLATMIGRMDYRVTGKADKPLSKSDIYVLSMVAKQIRDAVLDDFTRQTMGTEVDGIDLSNITSIEFERNLVSGELVLS